jgi:hypothetical protein
MKAAAYTRYGPPVLCPNHARGRARSEGQRSLIKVRAASVNPADWRLHPHKYFTKHLSAITDAFRNSTQKSEYALSRDGGDAGLIPRLMTLCCIWRARSREVVFGPEYTRCET